MATAAVGGSHLVASTKAGALYGWQLVGLVLLVNLLKYPFFRTAVSYSRHTGQNLVSGYKALGRGYLWAFLLVSLFAAVVNTAAVGMFCASLLGYFLPAGTPMLLLSVIVILGSLVLLLAGHYQLLDRFSKLLMSLLSIATVVAVLLASQAPQQPVAGFVAADPWSWAALGFLVALMGWMPAPIEISTITSMWYQRKYQRQPEARQDAMLDFNVGYIGTALLAVFFVALGALLFYGSGQALEKSGIGFSHQLVSMYVGAIGEWSRYLIAGIAFLCMLGTTLTVIDGYGRVLAESLRLLQGDAGHQPRDNALSMVLLSLVALAILALSRSALMPMLDFAMLLAFLSTPVFAWLNWRLVRKTGVEHAAWVNWLSVVGLAYLIGFVGLFSYWKLTS